MSRGKKSQLFLCFCKEGEVWISAEWSKCFLEDQLPGIHTSREPVAEIC